MKSAVLDTMKYSHYLLLILLFSGSLVLAQEKLEHEHRINKAQFPPIDMTIFTEVANGAKLKRIRYYKTVDSSQTIYALKFKMQRLHYQAHFDSDGVLNKIGFEVVEADFPSDAYAAIRAELANRFEKNNIRKMFQEYTVETAEDSQKIVKIAFQNLLLPTNRYRLIVVGSTNGSRDTYEAIFDADGRLKKIKNALPPNYDRVLY